MRTMPILLLGGSILFLAATGAGIYPWTTCVVAIIVSAVYVLWTWRPGCSSPLVDSRRWFTDVEWLSVAILAFLLITLIPLPLALTRHTGAARFEQNVTAAHAVKKAAAFHLADKPNTGFAFTRNRAGTLRMAALAIAMFGAAMITACLSRLHKRGYLRFLIAFGLVVGAAGYVGQWVIPQHDTLWWVLPIPHVLPGPVACFVNRNHFGGFLAMLCPAALAFLVNDLANRRWIHSVFCLGAFVVMGLATVFSLSRGSLLALAAGLLATAILSLTRRRVVMGLAVVALTAALAAVALSIESHVVKDRVRTLRNPLETASAQARLNEWRETLDVWRAYPIAGAGANALRMVYPQHRHTSRSGFLTHAENEYVQILAETGVIGIGLLVMLCAAMVGRARSVRASGEADPAVEVAAGGALAVAAVHAGFDFVLHQPLYAVVLASVAGLMLGPTPLNVAHAALGRLPFRRARVPGLFVLGAAIVVGTQWRPMHRLDSQARLLDAPMDEIARALVWAPTSSHVWDCMGSRAYAHELPAIRRFGAACLSQAAAYDPNNYHLWRKVGMARLEMKDYAAARAAFARVKALRYWVPVPEVPKD